MPTYFGNKINMLYLFKNSILSNSLNVYIIIKNIIRFIVYLIMNPNFKFI